MIRNIKNVPSYALIEIGDCVKSRVINSKYKKYTGIVTHIIGDRKNLIDSYIIGDETNPFYYVVEWSNNDVTRNPYYGIDYDEVETRNEKVRKLLHNKY